MEKQSSGRQYWPFILIMLLTELQLLLLFVGFTHYPGHPDEIGRRIIDEFPWNWRPLNFNYPTTHIYTQTLILVPLLDLLHHKLNFFEAYDIRLFNLAGRIMSSLMAVGCSFLAYFIARAAAYSKRHSVIFFALFSTFPLIINLGRFNTTDVPNLFWILAAILSVLQYVNNFDKRRLLISGAITGLAIGVKYTAILFVPGLIAAIAVAFLKKNNYTMKRLLTIVVAWIFVVLTFMVLSTPYAILDYKRFAADFLYLRERVPVWTGRFGPTAAVQIPRYIQEVFQLIVHIGLAFGLVRMLSRCLKPLHCMVLINVLVYYAFMFSNHFMPIRFVLPIFGMLLLISGVGFAYLLNLLSVLFNSKLKTLVTRACLVLISVGVLMQLRHSAAIAHNFYHETRYEAANWLKTNMHEGELVALPVKVYVYFPVDFLGKQRIWDIDDKDKTDWLSVKYGMICSFHSFSANETYFDFRKYLHDKWEIAQVFGMKPFLGVLPTYVEFLAPEIRIFKRPAEDEILIRPPSSS